jgi:RNA polymerase sigma-70 factor (ECF subfamily)
VHRAVLGEERAFRALYQRWRPRAARVAKAFADLDPDDVEDVVQDAFARAFGRVGALQTPERFGPWLLAIVRNRALTRLARQRAAAGLFRRIALESADEVASLPDLSNEAELEVVRGVLAELAPGPERDAVLLFYSEQKLTAREIAARLGVGKSAITMRLERFRAKVKRRVLAEVARLRGEESTR